MSMAATILRRARRRRWRLLPESEGFRLLSSWGVPVPAAIDFAKPEELTEDQLQRLVTDRVILRVSCPDLPHKTEVGGVVSVARDLGTVRQAARGMITRLSPRPVVGFVLQERVDYEPGPGRELLVSLRWDREFGPVLTCGPGGLQAERWARDLRPDRRLAVMAADGDLEEAADRIAATTVGGLMTRPHRGIAAPIEPQTLVGFLREFVERAAPELGEAVDEIEINPLVASRGAPIALDALIRVASRREAIYPPRPLQKLRCLLEPESLAIVGVSRRRNPGRIILENVLREGFDPARVLVIKPGEAAIDGCRCVPDLASLPARVDLLIVAVAAEQVPALLDQIIDQRLAESLIVIPGGMEDQGGAEESVAHVRQRLATSRTTSWGGPLVNGGNCMGIRSVPGRYDSFFLLNHKLPRVPGEGACTALLAQSGAFLGARSSKLARIPLRYSISIGNQLDLTFADYLEYLSDDEEVEVVALYVEGFQTLDGRRLLAAAQQFIAAGRRVILYRAGRTGAGARAATSHTAAMAGSYETTRALAEGTGILVAETLTEFEDLVTLAVRFRQRSLTGRGLAGVSNAGFECVAIADHLGGWRAPVFAPDTLLALRQLLIDVERLVTIRNPLDLTPMIGDEAFGRIVETVLRDPGVDVAVIGCVPLTGALSTLPPGPDHEEDVYDARGVASNLAAVWERTIKPWVVVVDAGEIYDPLVRELERRGLPVFRSVDRALRILGVLGRSEGVIAEPGVSQG